MYTPTARVNQVELKQSVDAAIQNVNQEEVVRVAYSVGQDSIDDPASFFRIVLADAASREDRLADVSGRVSSSSMR